MKNNLLSEKLVYGRHPHPDPPPSGALYAGRGARIHGRQPPADRTAILRKGDDLASSARAERDRNRAAGLRPVRYRLSGDAGYLNADHPTKVEEHERYMLVVAKFFRGGEEMQVCLVQGADFVLSFIESEVRFSTTSAGDPQQRLKFRSRPSDYCSAYCSTASRPTTPRSSPNWTATSTT